MNTYDNDLNGRYSMEFHLRSLSRDELKELARIKGIVGVEKKTETELAQELSSFLLEPASIQKTFQLLTDDEIRAFEAAAAAEGPYRMSEDDEELFDALISDGYLFYDAEGTCVEVPTELPALYRAISTSAFDRKRRQIHWIVRCLNDIVPPYYALMPLKKFCRLCRRTADPVIQPDEVPALLRELPEHFTECVITDDAVLSEELAEDQESYDYVVSAQGNKPWRIMREAEIAELLAWGYPPHDPNYRRFKDYLRKSFRLDDERIERITRRIHLRCAYSRGFDDLFEVFKEFHLKLTRRQAEDLARLFQELSNNTPTYYNRGYSPSQMADLR